ncbi:hypothetical protein NDU88_003986 [Pleurodeles waltl]|uniref:Uncharacterized protein n=1 Tax=Pleurodeles waltl TaxID=8319 RepID=A0AAV7M704_PLEWA|nr:hypothetical protein NDU88_003986 [Pleurodeles waltl]
MYPDFWVPGSVKVDDGLRDEREESIEDATEDAKEGEEEPDAGRRCGEGRAGNSDVPTERTGPVRKDSSEETRTHRHVPGGAWLNKELAAVEELLPETGVARMRDVEMYNPQDNLK